jgi:hypothetical protein
MDRNSFPTRLSDPLPLPIASANTHYQLSVPNDY